MNMRTGWIGGALFAALVIGLMGGRDADAKMSRGGRHSSGRSSRPPRISAPRRSFKPPRMPRVAAPAHANVSRPHPKIKTVQPRANTIRVTNASTTAHAYTYGAGTQARQYKAYGYGRGYRNRYVGGRRGYGRSQGNNRAIVSRLRSVRTSLARLDYGYKGHRVRALHSISMAIRQLSHRSMVYRGAGFSSRLNNGTRLSGAGVVARRARPLTQAQSDARMSLALRTLQGINMQLGSQGYHTSGQARARGHVQRATSEISTALAIR